MFYRLAILSLLMATPALADDLPFEQMKMPVSYLERYLNKDFLKFLITMATGVLMMNGVVVSLLTLSFKKNFRTLVASLLTCLLVLVLSISTDFIPTGYCGRDGLGCFFPILVLLVISYLAILFFSLRFFVKIKSWQSILVCMVSLIGAALLLWFVG